MFKVDSMYKLELKTFKLSINFNFNSFQPIKLKVSFTRTALRRGFDRGLNRIRVARFETVRIMFMLQKPTTV